MNEFIIVKILNKGKIKEVALNHGDTIEEALKEAKIVLTKNENVVLEDKQTSSLSLLGNLTESCTLVIKDIDKPSVSNKKKETVRKKANTSESKGKKIKEYVLVTIKFNDKKLKEVALETCTTVAEALKELEIKDEHVIISVLNDKACESANMDTLLMEDCVLDIKSKVKELKEEKDTEEIFDRIVSKYHAHTECVPVLFIIHTKVDVVKGTSIKEAFQALLETKIKLGDKDGVFGDVMEDFTLDDNIEEPSTILIE